MNVHLYLFSGILARSSLVSRYHLSARRWQKADPNEGGKMRQLEFWFHRRIRLPLRFAATSTLSLQIECPSCLIHSIAHPATNRPLA